MIYSRFRNRLIQEEHDIELRHLAKAKVSRSKSLAEIDITDNSMVGDLKVANRNTMATG